MTPSSPVKWLQGFSERPEEKEGPAKEPPLPDLHENWKDAALLVVLDFLTRHGYTSAAVALENETGVQLRDLSEDLLVLRSWITNGKWAACYDYLGAFDVGRTPESGEGQGQVQDIPGALSEIKKQAFFELLSQRERPTPVNELVDALEDIEKKCTTECFNECCFCMSLSKLEEHPPYRQWTIQKGRVACFENVLRCLGEESRKIDGVTEDSSHGNFPKLETVLRRSRAWLEDRRRWQAGSMVRDGTKANAPRAMRSEGPGDSHSVPLGESTDQLIDMCNRLNEKAELLTQSRESVVDENEEQPMDRKSREGGGVEGGLLRKKIRDISNASSHRHAGGCTHHHDLPCTPGYLSPAKKNSPEPKHLSPKLVRRRQEQRKSKAKANDGSPREGMNKQHISSPSSLSNTEAAKGEGSLNKKSPKRNLTTSFSDNTAHRNTATTNSSATSASFSSYESSDISRFGFISQQVLKDSHPIRCLSFCDKTNFMALGCNKEKALRVFQLKDQGSGVEEIFTRKRHHEGSIYCMEWKRKDGYLIATGSNDHQVKILSTYDFRGDSTVTFSGHNGTVRDISINNTCKLLASGGAGDNAIRLWDISNQRCVGELYSHKCMVTGVCFSKTDEHAYFSTDSCGSVLKWDARLEKHAFTFKGLRSDPIGISSLAVSGSQYLSVGYMDGCFQLLDVRKPSEIIFEKFIHSKECRSLDFSPGDKWLLSSSFDCMSHVISVQEGSLLCSSRGHSDKVVQGKWNPSQVQFATCSVDGTVQIHNPRQPLNMAGLEEEKGLLNLAS